MESHWDRLLVEIKDIIDAFAHTCSWCGARATSLDATCGHCNRFYCADHESFLGERCDRCKLRSDSSCGKYLTRCEECSEWQCMQCRWCCEVCRCLLSLCTTHVPSRTCVLCGRAACPGHILWIKDEKLALCLRCFEMFQYECSNRSGTLDWNTIDE